MLMLPADLVVPASYPRMLPVHALPPAPDSHSILPTALSLSAEKLGKKRSYCCVVSAAVFVAPQFASRGSLIQGVLRSFPLVWLLCQVTSPWLADQEGLYLLENGEDATIFIGRSVSEDLVRDVSAVCFA